MNPNHYHGRFMGGKKHLPVWIWLVIAALLILGIGAAVMLLAGQNPAEEPQPTAIAETQEAATVPTTVPEETAPASTAAPTETTSEPSTAPVETTAASTSAPTETTPAPTSAPAETTPPETEPAEITLTMLEQYQPLWEENPEFVGWLSIDGTIIDYPVMHTPYDREKYLYKNFQGEYYYHGTPFIDYRCTEDSDNLIIYSHNMTDGSMFHSLPFYEQKSYWESHPIIRFDSLWEEREFEVMAVFRDRVYLTSEEVFKFYNFIDVADEAEFNETIQILKEKSIYDTGVTPTYGQQLITLVTCAYHTEHGRFVVVACEKE